MGDGKNVQNNRIGLYDLDVSCRLYDIVRSKVGKIKTLEIALSQYLLTETQEL